MTNEFKAFLKLPGGGEIKRCYYPFKLDTYGRGCVNNCEYCYARSVLSFRKLWDAENPAVADFQKIERTLDLSLQGKGKFAKHFAARIPLRLGGMTDCFSDAEKTHRVTLRLLQLLKKYDYPYLILTKNALIAEPAYLEVLSPKLGYIQFSVTTPYDDVSRIFEKKASTTSERLKAMSVLAQNSFYVAGRINPMWPINPDGTHTGRLVMADQQREYKYFGWTLIDKLADAGCKTVICGFLRLSTWNLRWIKEATGEDVSWLFDPSTRQSNKALHFSTAEKKWYYEKAREFTHARGMEFSVCYDGDEDYETFRYLWANPNDCCNGKGKIRGFKNAFDFNNDAFLAKPEHGT